MFVFTNHQKLFKFNGRKKWNLLNEFCTCFHELINFYSYFLIFFLFCLRKQIVCPLVIKYSINVTTHGTEMKSKIVIFYFVLCLKKRRKRRNQLALKNDETNLICFIGNFIIKIVFLKKKQEEKFKKKTKWKFKIRKKKIKFKKKKHIWK